MENLNPGDLSAPVSKRKRTPGPEDGRQSVPPMVHSGAGNVPPINYLINVNADRLKLIEGDNEIFGDVLGMIDDYEGVLQRHESLAANLGAKLVGPLLLKSVEKLFDGPIKVISSSFTIDQSMVSWLDIITFARTHPSDFVLTESPSGGKACRFWLKGSQIEISEDDYRLIISGGPERMIPTQPVPEDEAAELGTLNILETRLATLIKKADAVAGRARQLNYHLKGRKAAILSRKPGEQPGGNAEHEKMNFSPQAFPTGGARSNGENSKIQQNLLDQFSAYNRASSIPHGRPKSNRVPTAESSPAFHTFNRTEPVDNRRLSQPLTDDGTEGQYRVLMASKIEKLSRGEPIYPPCDRCRRLKFDCTKHLTACQACTKKHAKCSWKDIREGELEHVPLINSGFLSGMSGATGGREGGPSRYGSAGVDANLDPNLRSETGAGSGGAGRGPGNDVSNGSGNGRGHAVMVHRDEQGGDAESEQAMLNQIIATAAGR